MLLIATASSISFLYQSFFVVSHENLSEAIIEGEMDYVFLRPVSSLLYYSLYRIDIPSFLNLAISVVVQIYLLTHYPLSIVQIVMYSVSLVLTSYFVFLLNHFAVCSSFWFEKARSIQGIPEYLMEFASRPLVIYPNTVRFIFTWILPILVGVNLPVLIVKGEAYRGYFVLLLIFDILGSVLAHRIWQSGIKRYVSAN